ncbi:MAG: AAA family ATPase, partial [Lachnospiraceae bacterium]|nr:AAA family ATPase [Lachnospiraceae bacterium]
MARVIASVNQKGGVGKTTITMNLGIGLARAGKKVLMIDFDPQGSLTDCLGFPEPDQMEITVAKVLMNSINDV